MSRQNRFKPDETIYVVVEGSFEEGITVFGPFKGRGKADEWATGRDGEVLELVEPDDE